MKERRDVVTLHGNPLTLLGPELKPGDKAPAFRLVDNGWKEATLADFAGKVLLLSVVPSLDTPVCGLQTRRFKEEAEKLPEAVEVVTVSRDLPFAQKRFCELVEMGRAKVLSDHLHREFGPAYGILVKEMELLARAIFVVGKDGKIVHIQVVPEIAEHPDYDAALEAARKAAAE